MMRLRFVVLLSVVAIPLVLSVSCKNGAKEAAREQQRQDSIAKAEAMQREADSLERVRIEQEAAEAALAAEAAAAAESKRPDPTLKFHVIVGGFVIQSNADNYLSQMQSQYSAARLFVAPNGFKLVSIGDFASYAEALQMMRGVGREDLWVYEEGGPYDTSSWLENRGDDFDGGDEDAYSTQGNSDAPVDEFDM